jgi:hypothetical protein
MKNSQNTIARRGGFAASAKMAASYYSMLRSGSLLAPALGVVPQP